MKVNALILGYGVFSILGPVQSCNLNVNFLAYAYENLYRMPKKYV
jgi:hypothetical protein